MAGDTLQCVCGGFFLISFYRLPEGVAVTKLACIKCKKVVPVAVMDDATRAAINAELQKRLDNGKQ